MEKQDGDFHPPMPPVDEEVEYLISHFFDVGPTMLTGASNSVPLSYAELRAWQDSLGIELQPWEARTIRRLSFEYLTQIQLAEKLECKAPWVGDAADDSIHRRMIARRMRDSIAELRSL